MSWQCPNAIVVPIRHHHDPELSPIELRPLAEIAQAAEFVADLWAVEERRLAVEDAEHALGELGLTCTHLESIVESINSEMSDACTMLGLDANLVSGFNPLHDELPERGHKVANR